MPRKALATRADGATDRTQGDDGEGMDRSPMRPRPFALADGRMNGDPRAPMPPLTMQFLDMRADGFQQKSGAERARLKPRVSSLV